MIHLKVFIAPWCAPCKAMQPHLEAIERSGILVVKIDIDEKPEVAAIHSVRSVPTLKLYNDNQLMKTATGTMTLAMLQEFIRL